MSTVHRAFALLRDWGLIEGEKGDRPRVLPVDDPADEPHSGAEDTPPALPASPAGELLDLVLRLHGKVITRFSTVVDRRDGRELEEVLVSAIRRCGGDEDRLVEYELEVRRPGEVEPITTFVASRRGHPAA